VTAEASPAVRAACLAKQEANFVLFPIDETEVIVGTKRIFVPSGNFLESELYHFSSLSFTYCNLSTAHSTCSAFIFSSGAAWSFLLILPLEALIGFHLTPILSPVRLLNRAESLSSSWALVEYNNQPASVVFSLLDALAHRLNSLFSREYFALSINTEKGRALAKIILHQLIPSSSLGII